MSDNELDAELLALAGDDSSSDEEDAKPLARQSRSPSQQATQSVEKPPQSPPRRGVAQKLKSRAAAKARKNRKAESEEEEDEEEEGEASAPTSPKSLGSAAMSESPSDTSPGDLDDDAPLYPIEGKFRSEKDKAEILSLTEIEREEILAERAAEVQRKTQDLQLKRLLAKRRDEAQGDQKKRKASAADLEDGERKTSRQKVKTSAPLEAYKRQRELKGQQRARDADRRRDQRSPSEEGGYSDQDAEGESEVEWDDRPARKASPAHDEPPPDLRAFDVARIGRSNFGEYCHNPHFEDLAKGCFCRVSTGMDQATGRNTYRLIQVKGFKEGRPYGLDGPKGMKVYTDRYVYATIGKAEKEWQYVACSDGRFTEAELETYKADLKDANQKLPSSRFMKQKAEDIYAIVHNSLTDPEIDMKVASRSALARKFANFGRDRIIRRRDEAISRGDEAYVARCTQELAQYDAGVAAKAAAKPSTPSKGLVQQDRLAALNKANRKANTEEIRKVQVAEKRAQQKARDQAMARARKAEADAAEAAKSKMLGVPGKMEDLFGDGSDISRAGTPLNGAGTPAKNLSRAGTPMNGLREKKSIGQFRKKTMEDDAIASMDLGIEIDI